MTPRKQSRRRSGAGGCITSASRRAEKSLSSTHNNKSVRFQTTQKDLLLRFAQNTLCLRAFLQNAERSRRYHHHHQRSSSSSAKTMMMMIRSSSSSRPTKARACHQKSVLKSKVPLCFFEVFLLFPPMFFPPFFSKTKKKKRKKKEACNLGYQMNTLKKGLSL